MTRDQEAIGMALLAPLRDEPLGPSSVDLDGAVVAATGRRRRRGLTVIGSAGLVLAVITAAAWTLYGRPPASPPVQIASPSLGTTGYQFDPRHQAFTVEPPVGFRIAAVITGSESQMVWLSRQRDSTNDGVNAYVTFYTPGVGPPGHAGEPWQPNEAERTAPINGRSAYLVKCPDLASSCALVYWKWSDDGWGFISVDIDSAGDTLAEGRAAAESLAISLASRSAPTHGRLVVRTPMTVAAPAGTELSSVLLRGEDRVDLIYLPAGDRPDSSGPSVVVRLRTGMITESPAPDTIDGHPARIEGTEVTIYEIAGDWSLEISAQPTNLLGGREQLVAFARSVQVVDNPDDRTSWLAL